MKVTQVVFADSKYNYVTDVSPLVNNEAIRRYFLGQFFEMFDGSEQKVIAVRFKYNVVSGSFAGESGYLDPFAKCVVLPMLHTKDGNRLGVAMTQLEQVI